VPLSAGFFEMNKNSDRRAEKRVGGEDGMGIAVDPVAPFITSASEDCPALDCFRSGFRFVTGIGAGVCGTGCGTADITAEGSAY